MESRLIPAESQPRLDPSVGRPVVLQGKEEGHHFRQPVKIPRSCVDQGADLVRDQKNV